jgi:hypothetical protein
MFLAGAIPPDSQLSISIPYFLHKVNNIYDLVKLFVFITLIDGTRALLYTRAI